MNKIFHWSNAILICFLRIYLCLRQNRRTLKNWRNDRENFTFVHSLKPTPQGRLTKKLFQQNHTLALHFLRKLEKKKTYRMRLFETRNLFNRLKHQVLQKQKCMISLFNNNIILVYFMYLKHIIFFKFQIIYYYKNFKILTINKKFD